MELDITFGPATVQTEINYSLMTKQLRKSVIIQKSPIKTRSQTRRLTNEMDISHMNSIAVEMAMPAAASETIYNENINSFVSAIDSMRLSPVEYAAAERKNGTIFDFSDPLNRSDELTETLLPRLRRKDETKIDASDIVEETCVSVAASGGGGGGDETAQIVKDKRQAFADRTKYFSGRIEEPTSHFQPASNYAVNKTNNKSELVDETCIQPIGQQDLAESDSSDRILIETAMSVDVSIKPVLSETNSSSMLVDDTINIPLNLLSSTKLTSNFFTTEPPRYSPIESILCEQEQRPQSAQFERTLQQIKANNDDDVQLHDDSPICLVEASSTMDLYGATRNNTSDLCNLTAGELYNNGKKTEPIAEEQQPQVLIRINNDHLHLSRFGADSCIQTPSLPPLSASQNSTVPSSPDSATTTNKRRLSFQCRKCKDCKRRLSIGDEVSMLPQYSDTDVSCSNVHHLEMWRLDQFDGTAGPGDVMRAWMIRDRKRERAQTGVDQNVWAPDIMFLIDNKRCVWRQ